MTIIVKKKFEMTHEGGFADEILCEGDVDRPDLSETDRALMALQEVLPSDEFIECQETFADKHCDLFDATGDLPPQFMMVHRQYVALVEAKLLQKVQETAPDFDFEELLPIVLAHKSGDALAFAEVFEILNAAIDFNEFRALMVSYKNGRDVALDVHAVKLDE
jgi:hypothetical protein